MFDPFRLAEDEPLEFAEALNGLFINDIVRARMKTDVLGRGKFPIVG